MLFLHNTSRVEDEPYGTLLQDKGFRGFPSLCFMDATGEVLAKQGARSVEAFEASFGKVKTLIELRKEAAKGDAKSVKKLFMAEIDLDLLSPEEIKAQSSKLTLSKEEAALVDSKLVDGEVQAILAKAREIGQEAAAEQVAAIATSGRRPTDAMAVNFWAMTLNHAANATDGKLATEAFGHLEKLAGDEPRYTRALDTWRKQLDKAKGDG